MVCLILYIAFFSYSRLVVTCVARVVFPVWTAIRLVGEPTESTFGRIFLGLFDHIAASRYVGGMAGRSCGCRLFDGS